MFGDPNPIAKIYGHRSPTWFQIIWSHMCIILAYGSSWHKIMEKIIGIDWYDNVKIQ